MYVWSNAAGWYWLHAEEIRMSASWVHQVSDNSISVRNYDIWHVPAQVSSTWAWICRPTSCIAGWMWCANTARLARICKYWLPVFHVHPTFLFATWVRNEPAGRWTGIEKMYGLRIAACWMIRRLSFLQAKALELRIALLQTWDLPLALRPSGSI